MLCALGHVDEKVVLAMNKAHSHLKIHPEEKTRTMMGERPPALAPPQGVRWVKSQGKAMREHTTRKFREAQAIVQEIDHWEPRMKPGPRTDEYSKGQKYIKSHGYQTFASV